MTAPLWINLAGAANVRDLGGLPAGDRSVRPGRLIRADNLQDLTPDDVRELVEARHVSTVIDLRTEAEIDSEGPGPLDADERVQIHRLSLFPAVGRNTDVTAAESDGRVVLPWHTARTATKERLTAADMYLRYLADRADSAVGALRLVAHATGATVVHCAAGKDRTGVIVALALEEVGVDRDAIVADYVRSADRLAGIVRRLSSTPTYARDIDAADPGRHAPRAATLEVALSALDQQHGGAREWLRAHGWSPDDAAALRESLLGS